MWQTRHGLDASCAPKRYKTLFWSSCYTRHYKNEVFFTLIPHQHWLPLIFFKRFSKNDGYPKQALMLLLAQGHHWVFISQHKEERGYIPAESQLCLEGILLQDKPPFHTRNSSKPLSFSFKPERSCSPMNRKTLALCPQSLQELSKSYKTRCTICWVTKVKGNTELWTEYLISEGILPTPLGKAKKPCVCCSEVFSRTRLA